ncbi:unnamed protein product [Gongylonema pulchrum]|uniref:Peptidase_M16_C domain-containing protein n=1 Tax=Gongylonema pulchrum TaxID=637853 RepID=A0A183D5S2_9BILA|nr:unnamed protein product [Gongylonema pulchrum]
MEKIRKYHHDFYHINNMFVIVCGSIDHNKLLQILQDVEDRTYQRVPQSFTVPFKQPMQTFTEAIETKIVCPSEDNMLGVVAIAWAGPRNHVRLLL